MDITYHNLHTVSIKVELGIRSFFYNYLQKLPNSWNLYLLVRRPLFESIVVEENSNLLYLGKNNYEFIVLIDRLDFQVSLNIITESWENYYSFEVLATPNQISNFNLNLIREAAQIKTENIKCFSFSKAFEDDVIFIRKSIPLSWDLLEIPSR